MPLPFIVGGGVVVGLAAIVAAFKKKCSVCKSYLTLNDQCFLCGRYVCGKCGADIKFGRICNTKHGNIDNALKCYQRVELFSKNYKGKLPPLKRQEELSTAYYKNKDTAENALKFIASIQGATCVQQVAFTKDTGQDGNYIYSTWSAEGII